MSVWNDLPSDDWWDSVSFGGAAGGAAGSAVGKIAGDVPRGPGPGTSGGGFSMSKGEMQQALKLARNMLEDLEDRQYNVERFSQITPPSDDPASTRYTKGGWMASFFGGGKNAISAGDAYREASKRQMNYLEKLIEKLEGALGITTKRDEEAQDSFKTQEGKLG